MSDFDLHRNSASRRLAKLSELLALVFFSVGALAVGLVVIPEWFDQAQLPKRVALGLFGPVSLAFSALAVLLDPGKFTWGRAGRWLLALHGLQLAWAIFVTFDAINPSVAFDELVDMAAGLSWMAAGLMLFSRRRSLVVAGGVVVLIAGLAAAVGLGQYAVANPGRFPFSIGALASLEDVLVASAANLGWDALRQAAVPASLYGHANFGGELLAILAPILAILALAGGRVCLARSELRVSAWRRMSGGLGAMGALALLGVVGLYVARSSSRAALLSMLAGLGLIALHGVIERGRRRPLFGSGGLHATAFALLAIALLGGTWTAASLTDFQPRHGQTRTSLARRLSSAFDLRNTTVRERLDLWGNSLSIAEDRPVFGVGPGGFGRAYPAWADARREHAPGRLTLRRQPAHAHNELVEILVERGCMGLGLSLLMLLVLILAGWTRFWRSWRRDLRSGDLGRGYLTAGLAGALLALGLTSLASFPFHHAPTLLAGILATAALVSSRSGEAHARPFSRGLAFLLIAFAAALLGVGLPRLAGAGQASRDLAVTFEQRGVAADLVETDLVVAQRSRGLRELRHLDAALARRPEDHFLNLARAEALRRFGRRAEARQAFERTLELHPYLVNAWLGLAELELAAGRLEPSRRAARRALELKDDAPAAHLALARVDAASGFERRAWSGLRAGLALDPIGPERLAILVELVRAAAGRGDARFASLFLDEARTLAPGHPAVVLAAARVAQRFAPGSPQAMRAWEAVLGEGNENFEAGLQLGIARLTAGDPSAAFEAIERARPLSPRDPALLFHRARALMALGRSAEANVDLLRCMQVTARPGGDLVLFERAATLAASLRDSARRAESGAAQDAEGEGGVK